MDTCDWCWLPLGRRTALKSSHHRHPHRVAKGFCWQVEGLEVEVKRDPEGLEQQHNDDRAREGHITECLGVTIAIVMISFSRAGFCINTNTHMCRFTVGWSFKRLELHKFGLIKIFKCFKHIGVILRRHSSHPESFRYPWNFAEVNFPISGDGGVERHLIFLYF